MSALSQLKLLVNLAMIDDEVTDKEKKYITNIGLANGLTEQDVVYLFNQNHEVIVPQGISDDRKFDYLFSLVQLMKIDERLYKEEIKYCSHVAAKLGYKQEVMFELMLKVSTTMKKAEIESLRKLVSSLLIK
ncbi:MAG TPA: TerB family tellurite resistance protein [Cyclobacteriaceae bacterium]|nr:TerB family tellurite resistance protein [Cyclobacteriaceae bacterium]HNP05981.1 TerB family tellurite resistance protein [Cyclobacteriaceae bacterium]HRK54972.1 TerB family tellurite resistance protein [Cyclobacteriaceae bacterium]